MQHGPPDRQAAPRARAVSHGEGQGDLTALLRACLAALRLSDQAEPWPPRPRRLWRVAAAIARIETLLGKLPAGSPLSAFLPALDQEETEITLHRRAAVASTLVAGLELARGGALSLEQTRLWQPIAVHSKSEAR